MLCAAVFYYPVHKAFYRILYYKAQKNHIQALHCIWFTYLLKVTAAAASLLL
jgi:hypothetical protein